MLLGPTQPLPSPGICLICITRRECGQGTAEVNKKRGSSERLLRRSDQGAGPPGRGPSQGRGRRQSRKAPAVLMPRRLPSFKSAELPRVSAHRRFFFFVCFGHLRWATRGPRPLLKTRPLTQPWAGPGALGPQRLWANTGSEHRPRPPAWSRRLRSSAGSPLSALPPP